MTRQLTVFTRQGCHLCTEMIQALEYLRPELGFEFSTVDIDTDPELASQYNTRVPALVADGMEVCYYVLEEDLLRKHLQAPRNSGDSLLNSLVIEMAKLIARR